MPRFLCYSLFLQFRPRYLTTMAATPALSPFSQAVVNAMRTIYPESLADKSFDNTGLLLESPFDAKQQLKKSVLLTTDLTKAVADEAIARRDSIIVAYHPIIFRGLKSLTLQDPQQKTLLRLAQEGISVYSPHTAVDAVPGGMADWLCDIVSGAVSNLSSGPQGQDQEHGSSSLRYSGIIYPKLGNNEISATSVIPHTRTTIHPSPAPIPDGFEGAGAGRIVTFEIAQPLLVLIDLIGTATGNPGALSIAIPHGASVPALRIKTVGVCPGSGSGVLMKGAELPDLLFTGELSHHEALAAIERGSVVITLFHSNTERGYLFDVMQHKLAEAIKLELGGQGPTGAEPLVAVSRADRDPYGFVVRK
ncbi:putative NGG1 interacting factor Nif3 [Talaromyces proteolyticus]|uniref:NGG1 interacting factor Nif3 n=1 Tax=Talaromyces proteolyticus TaxID=1131652 RepID=A0AAD4L0P1_9EURO|nr:putative NGG1 interacting factor Nif3 [Talaromyces proteolyticus]KAH8701715.1 putative NGG1 interacting factor Nif3 [Talaromyces proteolyticus]